MSGKPFTVVLVVAIAGCGGRTGLRVDDSDTGSSSSSSSSGAGGEGGAPPSGVVELALGAQHSCVRTLTGGVYCWGGNGHGQVGVPSGETILSPQKVKLPGAAASVAAGTYTTCAVLADGRLFCWGENADAELGSGGGADAEEPVQVPMPTLDPVVKVVAGEAHVCALTVTAPTEPTGTLWCWGRNASGQVGVGAVSAMIPGPLFVEENVSDVALGAFHSNAVVGSGEDAAHALLGWGTNEAHQTGFDGAVELHEPLFVLQVSPFAKVRSGRGAHSCALEAGGAVECWGVNTSGQLGRGFTSESELPGFATTAIGFDALAVGFAHTCGLSAGGVFCWGANGDGQLGDGTTESASLVKPVTGLSEVKAIAAGTLHTCAFLSETDIRCWGANDFGQLGDGTTAGKLSPVSIQLP